MREAGQYGQDIHETPKDRGMTARWQADMIGGMRRFVDDESAYLQWLADHPSDYVINTYRNPSAGYLMMHRADCHTIGSVPDEGSNYTGGDYCKVCGRRDELEKFADQLGGSVQPCGTCLATEAALNGRALDRSRYGPLRDYLARCPSGEVEMTFADIEQLVGALPDSARLHRAWWSNSSNAARAWMAAGWRLKSVDQSAGQVVFARGSLEPAGDRNSVPGPRGPYVDGQVIAAIKAYEPRDRFDRAKLLRLIDELNDNYLRGNTYAAHALLRAILDHIPPLLGGADFTAAANNYPWGPHGQGVHATVAGLQAPSRRRAAQADLRQDRSAQPGRHAAQSVRKPTPSGMRDLTRSDTGMVTPQKAGRRQEASLEPMAIRSL